MHNLKIRLTSNLDCCRDLGTLLDRWSDENRVKHNANSRVKSRIKNKKFGI